MKLPDHEIHQIKNHNIKASSILLNVIKKKSILNISPKKKIKSF